MRPSCGPPELTQSPLHGPVVGYTRPACFAITRCDFVRPDRVRNRSRDPARLSMSVRPYRDIHRRQSRRIHVGRVPVGGGAPITVQPMTNTLTHDVAATVAPIPRAEAPGVDIVPVSCPAAESPAALKDIVRQVSVPHVSERA